VVRRALALAPTLSLCDTRVASSPRADVAFALCHALPRLGRPFVVWQALHDEAGSGRGAFREGLSMNGRPFAIPSDLQPALKLTPLVRGVIAYAHAALFGGDRNAGRVVKQLWPDDKATLGLVERAATSEATTADAAWAGPLATYRVQELLQNLGPLSAGSRLLRQGIALTFDRNAEIRVPGITVSASFANWVGERGLIPVHQLPVSAGAILDPRKFGTIITLTREMMVSSNAEALTRTVLIDAVAASLDVALFSNVAGDSTRPAGLLYGAKSETPTAGGGSQAMLTDLATLAADVSPYGGLDLTYICAPAEAVKLTFAMGAQFKIPVLASSGVPAKTLICIAPVALCSASDPAPRLEAARDVALSMDDSAPVGMPSRSMFQTDSVSIRLTMFVSWAMRAPLACAYCSNVTW